MFRVCTSEGISSCKHSAEEVLDYTGANKLEEKINGPCGDICQEMKEHADKAMEELIAYGNEFFSDELTQSFWTMANWTKLQKDFSIIQAKYGRAVMLTFHEGAQLGLCIK